MNRKHIKTGALEASDEALTRDAPAQNPLSGNLRQVRNTSEGSAEMLATCCGFENRHEESPPALSCGARVVVDGGRLARVPLNFVLAIVSPIADNNRHDVF